MAYMHKETFDIVVENSWKNPNDYFHVDDLIALPVQALNRKGYTTTSCCAGHPFDYLGENMIYVDESEATNAALLAARKTFKNFNCYIAFKTGVSLPTLPPGFIKRPFGDHLCIDRDYEDMDYIYQGTPVTVNGLKAGNLTFPNPQISDGDVYRFMRDITGIMEQLYEWALNLPEPKDAR